MQSPDQHAALLSFLSNINWDNVLSQTDVQAAFDVFYDSALTILNSFYPLHTIAVLNRDPHFVTPRIIALLLRHRNRLMRKGAVSAADSLTVRIGHRVKGCNRALLTQLPCRSKEMWSQSARSQGKTSASVIVAVIRSQMSS